MKRYIECKDCKTKLLRAWRVYMEHLELVAAILASGVVAQKSSMSPEKAVDEAITAYSQIAAKLEQLEAKQKQLKNAA